MHTAQGFQAADNRLPSSRCARLSAFCLAQEFKQVAALGRIGDKKAIQDRLAQLLAASKILFEIDEVIAKLLGECAFGAEQAPRVTVGASS